MNREDRLSNRVLFGYGLASAPVMYAYVLVLIMYMKYAVDDLGAEPAIIGTIFLVAKFWDAVSDPLIGNFSDRTQLSSGRRRPWLYASAPLLAIFGIMVWAPPASLEGWGLNLWILIAVLGFYTAYTSFDVPHMALGAEISLDTGGRNRVFGVRQGMRILGMLTAGILGTYLVGQGASSAAVMAYALGALTIIFILTGTSLLPPERAAFKGRGGENPYRALRDVVTNPHARLLLFVVFIDAIGVGGIGVLIPFVVEYVVKMEGLLPILLGAHMLSSLVSVPIWIWLARHFEKRTLMLSAMLASAVGYGGIIFVSEGRWEVIAISSVIAGAATTCMNVLGYTLKSEIIDCDEYLTGERKEGAYFAGWSFVNKLAGGIMIGLVGFALQWSDFQPNQPDQTELVQNTIVFLMSGFPFVCFVIGAIAFSRFDLSESEHARIRKELDSQPAPSES